MRMISPIMDVWIQRGSVHWELFAVELRENKTHGDLFPQLRQQLVGLSLPTTKANEGPEPGLLKPPPHPTHLKLTLPPSAEWEGSSICLLS